MTNEERISTARIYRNQIAALREKLDAMRAMFDQLEEELRFCERTAENDLKPVRRGRPAA